LKSVNDIKPRSERNNTSKASWKQGEIRRHKSADKKLNLSAVIAKKRDSLDNIRDQDEKK